MADGRHRRGDADRAGRRARPARGDRDGELQGDDRGRPGRGGSADRRGPHLGAGRLSRGAGAAR